MGKEINMWFQAEERTIPEIIHLNSRWMANKVALVCDDKQVTWSELGEIINKIGHSLLKLNLNSGDRIVLMTRNSNEMMESILGIICTSMVVVPLNISINDSAIVTMVNNCEAKAVIASDEFVDRIDSIKSQLKTVSDDCFISINTSKSYWHDYHQLLNNADSSPVDLKVAPESECNIIYSSGTTGLPKGIVHSHSCRFAWAQGMSISLRYDSSAKTLLSLGLYSNISWVAFLNTILVGGTMYVVTKFDAEECMQAIQEYQITHFAMVPIQYQKILTHENFSQYNLSSIKATMCCGSPLTVEMKKTIMDNLPGDFIELYGLTEGLITILPPEEMNEKINSVGRPYPGQELMIIDNDDNPVETGESGEIVGISAVLMSGYLNNEKANSDATWYDKNNRKWLRTGDIGRLDDDGFLYLVDRKKDMIISGGQNIYPADIEAILSRREEIKELAVIGIDCKKWGETPIAIIVAEEKAIINVNEIMQWLNSKLGKQQRVSSIIQVQSLPRNPAGKVLKRVLRETYKELEI